MFPVKTSFFGAVDTAGFPKDQYWLFRSQWTREPMVHLVPMDWTRHEPGETVQVRAYANVDSVELRLNGRSLGVKRFDRKRSPSGEEYLETTEPTGDDKTFASGSYESPSGSSGHLYLRWDVPFEPGRLEAVARRGGAVVARDAVSTAGPAGARCGCPRPGPFVTARVVDRHGVVVPGADDLISWDVSGGGFIAGLDNGREEDPEGFKGTAHTAFNGLALAIVGGSGPARVTASAPGLRADSVRVRRGVAVARPPAQTPPAFETGAADASYSGRQDTIPEAMLDGDPATGWSNFYVADPTALLPEISIPRARDWVSVALSAPRSVDSVVAHFTDGAPVRAAVGDRGAGVGREPLDAGERPARRRRPADDDHVRPGADLAAAAA